MGRLLFRLARSRFFGRFVGVGFQYFSWFLPLRRLRENRDAILCHHPRPSFDQHLLLVPKRAIRDFVSLTEHSNARYLRAIFDLARSVIEAQPGPWVLGVNGGDRQDVGQVHFHLYREPPRMIEPVCSAPKSDPPIEVGSAAAYPHPAGNWTMHTIIEVDIPRAGDGLNRVMTAILARDDTWEGGYSVFVQPDHLGDGRTILHFVSGDRRYN